MPFLRELLKQSALRQGNSALAAAIDEHEAAAAPSNFSSVNTRISNDGSNLPAVVAYITSAKAEPGKGTWEKNTVGVLLSSFRDVQIEPGKGELLDQHTVKLAVQWVKPLTEEQKKEERAGSNKKYSRALSSETCVLRTGNKVEVTVFGPKPKVGELDLQPGMAVIVRNFLPDRNFDADGKDKYGLGFSAESFVALNPALAPSMLEEALHQAELYNGLPDLSFANGFGFENQTPEERDFEKAPLKENEKRKAADKNRIILSKTPQSERPFVRASFVLPFHASDPKIVDHFANPGHQQRCVLITDSPTIGTELTHKGANGDTSKDQIKLALKSVVMMRTEDGSLKNVIVSAQLWQNVLTVFGVARQERWAALAPRLISNARAWLVGQTDLEATVQQEENISGHDPLSSGINCAVVLRASYLHVDLPELLQRIGFPINADSAKILLNNCLKTEVSSMTSAAEKNPYNRLPNARVRNLFEQNNTNVDALKDDYDFYLVLADFSWDEESIQPLVDKMKRKYPSDWFTLLSKCLLDPGSVPEFKSFPATVKRHLKPDTYCLFAVRRPEPLAGSKRSAAEESAPAKAHKPESKSEDEEEDDDEEEF
jgi:hypothetical protein